MRFARVGSDGEVWLIDPDLGEPVRVTTTPDAETDVRFSATGDRLFYRRGQDWFGWTLEGGKEAPLLHLAAGRDATKPLAEDQNSSASTRRSRSSSATSRRPAMPPWSTPRRLAMTAEKWRACRSF